MLRFEPGSVIVDRYRVKRKIGKGGMGEVYLVRDVTSGERRALKTILPQYSQNQKVVDRFIREVNAQRILDHPGIVKILGARKVDDTLFYVMEYLDGVNVRSMLRNGAISVPTTFRVLYLLCQALEHAHLHTVHRDVSPDNVMVTRDGSVKLLDFGLAKLTESDSDLTRTGMFLGKIHYSAPEQGENAKEVDLRADIYSLGVMFYEMASGTLPTATSKLSKLVPELPVAVDELIDKARRQNPADRHQNAKEFRQHLVQVHGLYAGIEYPQSVLDGDEDPAFVTDPSETVQFVHDFIKAYIELQKAEGGPVLFTDDEDADERTEVAETVPATLPDSDLDGETTRPGSDPNDDSGVVSMPTSVTTDELYKIKKDVAKLASSLGILSDDFGNLANQFKSFVEKFSDHGTELASDEVKLERLQGDLDGEKVKLNDLREKVAEVGDVSRKYTVQMTMLETSSKQAQADVKALADQLEKLKLKVNKSLKGPAESAPAPQSPPEVQGASNPVLPIIAGAVAGGIIALIISLVF